MTSALWALVQNSHRQQKGMNVVKILDNNPTETSALEKICHCTVGCLSGSSFVLREGL
jgi:hypothetical protein